MTKDEQVAELKQALKDPSKVLKYVAPEDIDATHYFMRLKIPHGFIYICYNIYDIHEDPLGCLSKDCKYQYKEQHAVKLEYLRQFIGQSPENFYVLNKKDLVKIVDNDC